MPVNVLVGRTSGRGGGRMRKGLAEPAAAFEGEKDPLVKRETLELVRAYYKITEPRLRKRLFELVKVAGASSKAGTLGVIGKRGRGKRLI
jgi:hypothetical protein